MRIAVVGLGSMGKRRIRLLRKIDPSFVIVGIDANDARRSEASAQFGIVCESSLKKAQRQVNICFVCTPPLTHSEIIADCLQNGLHVFTELNLVSDGYEELMALAKQQQVTLFLSSTMLYRKEISYICAQCKGKEGLSYQYHVGQYLPDWHPWENYQQFFVNEIRSNGCRELFAVEMPWLCEAFGAVQSVQVIKAKQSALALAYPDTFMVLLTHVDGAMGTLWIDVVARKAVRKLEISGEQLHLTWNGTPQSLSIYDIKLKKDQSIQLYTDVEQDNRYSDNIIENAYVDEILSFFGVVAKVEDAKYSFAKDQFVLQVIDCIEGIAV